MKNINYSFLFILLLAFTFSACLDEIELSDSVDLEENIAIQGSLIMGAPSKVDVFVSRLSNLTGVNLPKAILDAEVFILDENGTEYMLDNINSGFYELEIPASDPFVVDVNKSYQLKVRLIDGKIYESTFEVLLPVPKISSLGLNIVEREVTNTVTGQVTLQDRLEFVVNTPVITSGAATKSQMIWELQGTYQVTDTPEASCRPTSNFPDPKVCYVTEKINLDKVVTFDGTKVSSDELLDFPVYEGGINFRFTQGYYMTFLQRSLTLGAHKYWTTTNDMLQRSGSLFEAPAGKIESNFKNTSNPEEEVFGYFYASEQDTARIFVEPSFVGNPASSCPIEFDPLSPPSHCCNCLTLDNSSGVRPDWW